METDRRIDSVNSACIPAESVRITDNSFYNLSSDRKDSRMGKNVVQTGKAGAAENICSTISATQQTVNNYRKKTQLQEIFMKN